MNRSFRDSIRSIPQQPHRRSIGLHQNGKESADDNLDLFSKSRRSLPLASLDEPDVPLKLGRLSLGSARPTKNGLDDFLSSADGGKHDYDWLLTPPGTPSGTLKGNESNNGLIAPRRSLSTTKASRLSVSHSENNVGKHTRSSSMTRPSISSYSNKSSTNILNTSSASVSSYIRPSTPTRSSSITRPSTPTRPTVTRSSTPSRTRPSLTTPSTDKPRAASNSRPSTPTSRPQISANMNSFAPRTTSRPSTPTRRNSAPSLSPASIPSSPGGRSLTNGRISGAPVSRPSSPGPRTRAPSQPIVLPDFPLDTPPNLRTSLPDRPISAGRSRPSATLASKGHVEPMANSFSAPKRQPSPVGSRGRLAEPTSRGRTVTKENYNDTVDLRRVSSQKPAKVSTDSTGFGRTISKKSLDMAIRHMDIKNSSNGFRPLTGSNLFPQSIRSTNQKSPSSAMSNNGSLSSISSNGAISENGNHPMRYSENAREEDRTRFSAKLMNNIDIYESSRYDMILFKEDVKNANWLHSLDDKSDQGPIFDNGFESLPEPFDTL